MGANGNVSRKGAIVNKKSLPVALIMLLSAALVSKASAGPAASAAKLKVVFPLVSAEDPARTLNITGTAPERRLMPALGGYVYDDAESAIEVYATIGMMSGGTNWTIFRTWVHSPEQIEIRNMVPFALYQDASLPLVPPSYPDGSTHWYEFLNGFHPYDSHYLVDVVFAGPYVPTRADADWENKPIGWTLCGRVAISIMPEEFTSSDCHLCLADHHQIFIQSHKAKLIKESATTYRLVVNEDFSDTSRLWGTAPPWTTHIAKDYILHRFCDCVARVSKRTTYEVMEYHYPEIGYAPFNLEMLYIKY